MKRAFLLISFMAAMLAGSIFAPTPYAMALVEDACQYDTGGSDVCSKQSDSDVKPVFQTIINFLLWLSIIISVIVIIVSGAKYVLSGGDSSKVASSKNALIGATLGALVSVLALALVNFVIDFISK